jgi:NAD(P)-dependent dehydrogenase (short-subunit alcohol dehydrogenase family)
MNLQDIQHYYDFTGKTVVITGGSGILGGEMAVAFAGLGAKVAVLSRAGKLSDELGERVTAVAGRVVALPADVLQRQTVLDAEKVIQTQFGDTDILINAAGGNRPGATTYGQSFFDIPEEAMRHGTDLNLLGTVLPSQIFGRGMAERKSGVIINIASMASLKPLTKIVAYSMAKAGVSNFTQWLAVYMAMEYSPHIRVNAIAPGFFVTHQNRTVLTNPEAGTLTPRGESIIAHTPMGRFGEAKDLLGATLWLASPLAAFVTGIVLPVDGGFSAFSGV